MYDLIEPSVLQCVRQERGQTSRSGATGGSAARRHRATALEGVGGVLKASRLARHIGHDDLEEVGTSRLDSGEDRGDLYLTGHGEDLSERAALAAVMSTGSSTATMPALRACRASSACKKSSTRRASWSIFQTSTASNGSGESSTGRQRARSSGLLWAAETPSSVNVATTCQPRSAAYCSAASIWRSIATEGFLGD